MSTAIESNDELEKLCERLCKMPDGGRVSVGPLEVCAETQDAPKCSGVSCRRPFPGTRQANSSVQRQLQEARAEWRRRHPKAQ